MGLIHVRAGFAPQLVHTYDSLDPDGDYDGRDRDGMYMTAYLQLLIDRGTPVAAVPVDGGWLEVDTTRDLDTYEALRGGRRARPLLRVGRSVTRWHCFGRKNGRKGYQKLDDATRAITFYAEDGGSWPHFEPILRGADRAARPRGLLPDVERGRPRSSSATTRASTRSRSARASAARSSSRRWRRACSWQPCRSSASRCCRGRSAPGALGTHVRVRVPLDGEHAHDLRARRLRPLRHGVLRRPVHARRDPQARGAAAACRRRSSSTTATGGSTRSSTPRPRPARGRAGRIRRSC